MKPVISSRAVIIVAFLLLVAIKIVLMDRVLSSGTIGPQALNDELIYRLNSESIFNKEQYYSTHYPPFYPLLLSFAFFSKNNWYQWMFYINAVLSSLVLIPVWFISLKFLSRTASMWVLLISSISTFHFFYPGLIMSENIAVPIFAFSVYLLLDSGRGSPSKKVIVSMLLGITMALGYMTKYLYIMSIPALVLLWFIKPMSHEQPEERSIEITSRRVELLAMFAGFILMYIPWFIYQRYSGSSGAGGTGVEFVLSGIPESAGLESFVLWSGLYFSYIILALAPLLLFLIYYLFMLSSKRVENNRQETFFIIALMLLSAIFFITAVQHSWRCGYNYPIPYKIHGRYLMHLMPLWVIVFMVALDKVKNVLTGTNMTHIIYACLLCLTLLCFPLVLLMLSEYGRSLSESYPDAPDVLLYMTKTFIVFFAAIYVILGIVLSWCRRNRFMARHFVLLVCALVIAIQANTAFTAYTYMLSNRTEYQLHGRALSPFMSQEVLKNHKKIVIVSDQTELVGKFFRLQESLQFWVSGSATIPSIKVTSSKEILTNEENWNGKHFSITTELNGNPVYNYMVDGKHYYVYDINIQMGKITGLPPQTQFETEKEGVES